MNPRQPYNPFSRDEYPALTDAIRGVVNGQPREVEEAASPAEGKKPSNPFNPTLGDLLKSKQQDKKADVKTKGVKEEVTPKRMEVLNRAVKTGMAGGLRNAQSRALADRASLAITRAYATKGGKKVTGFDKAKREHEGAKAHHKTLKSTSAGVNEDIQTPAREREMLGKMKRAEARTDAEGKRYMRATGSAFATSKTKAERVKKIGKASKRYNTALSAQDKTYATQRKEEMSRRLYGKGGKLVKRAVKESQELSERIIDEVDFFQASKNWVKGKGFKTNREVSAAQVEKNYQAMKKRQEAEAKKNK